MPNNSTTEVTTSAQLDALKNTNDVVSYNNNAVTGHSTYGVVFIRTFTNSWPVTVQIEFCNVGTTYIRFIWNPINQTNVWTSWSRYDSFGYNTLSDLASALGGDESKTITDFNSFNTNTSTKKVFVTSGSNTNIPNAPVSTNIRGWLTVRSLANGSYIHQEFINGYDGTIYVRSCNDGTWGTWKQISMT